MDLQHIRHQDIPPTALHPALPAEAVSSNCLHINGSRESILRWLYDLLRWKLPAHPSKLDSDATRIHMREPAGRLARNRGGEPHHRCRYPLSSDAKCVPPSITPKNKSSGRSHFWHRLFYAHREHYAASHDPANRRQRLYLHCCPGRYLVRFRAHNDDHLCMPADYAATVQTILADKHALKVWSWLQQ